MKKKILSMEKKTFSLWYGKFIIFFLLSSNFPKRKFNQIFNSFLIEKIHAINFPYFSSIMNRLKNKKIKNSIKWYWRQKKCIMERVFEDSHVIYVFHFSLVRIRFAAMEFFHVFFFAILFKKYRAKDAALHKTLFFLYFNYF